MLIVSLQLQFAPPLPFGIQRVHSYSISQVFHQIQMLSQAIIRWKTVIFTTYYFIAFSRLSHSENAFARPQMECAA